MKKIILVIFLIAVYSFCQAQNWSCFVPGQKQYFTNNYHYLRGIRIDSVKIIGSNIVYYPFHTPRGPYLGLTTFDSTGGSWVGKRILQLTDGTFLFDNEWGDTVIIKTMANAGDSWTFYNDTTKLYYRADVLSKDTMTVLSMLDSIKIIQIRAFSDTGYVKKDVTDSFKIILSKNHGFAQVFDLYVFPYHKPNALPSMGLDYYLDKVSGWFGDAKYFNPDYSMSSFIDSNSALFKLTKFSNTTLRELNGSSVEGDIFEYSNCNASPAFGDCSTSGPSSYDIDTIVSIDTTGGLLTIHYVGAEKRLNVYPPHTYSVGMHTTGLYKYNDNNIFPDSLMPEEFMQGVDYFYMHNDTNFCTLGDIYGIRNNHELHGARYTPPFEGPWEKTVYKKGVGLLHYNDLGMDGGPLAYDISLIYRYHNGIDCGVYEPVGIRRVKSAEDIFEMYPNPAHDEVIIEARGIGEVIINNSIGQIVYTQSNKSNKLNVDVSGWLPGVYFVRINLTPSLSTSGEGVIVRKFVKD